MASNGSGSPANTPGAVVVDERRLAVHQLGRPHHRRRRRPGRWPGGRGRRRAPGTRPANARDQLEQDAGVLGPARARATAARRRARGARASSTRERVVAVHDRLGARARPGTARGCRRSCRSCRRRAPAGPTRQGARVRPVAVSNGDRCSATVDAPMAPPKRKAGGRVTPKGTKPGELPRRRHRAGHAAVEHTARHRAAPATVVVALHARRCPAR